MAGCKEQGGGGQELRKVNGGLSLPAQSRLSSLPGFTLLEGRTHVGSATWNRVMQSGPQVLLWLWSRDGAGPVESAKVGVWKNSALVGYPRHPQLLLIDYFLEQF